MYGRNTFYRVQPGRSYYNGPRRGQSFAGVNVPPMVDFSDRKWVAFKEVQPVRAAWIEAKAMSFDFAASMHNAVVRYGDLTPKQGETVDRLAARDAAPRAPQAAPATFPKIMAAFAALIANGGRKPVTIGDVTISVAPASGVNAGSLYVKVGGEYAGKIMTDGVLRAVRTAPADLAAKLAVIEADPRGAVQAHAARLAAELAANIAAREAAIAAGTTPPAPLSLPCGCCGLTLTDPVSVARGIGPICAGRWGF
jgi:hypothetical protein